MEEAEKISDIVYNKQIFLLQLNQYKTLDFNHNNNENGNKT